MIDFIFKGKITLNSNNKEEFINKFDMFLKENNANFTGNLEFIEFEEAIIIEDEE